MLSNTLHGHLSFYFYTHVAVSTVNSRNLFKIRQNHAPFQYLRTYGLLKPNFATTCTNATIGSIEHTKLTRCNALNGGGRSN